MFHHPAQVLTALSLSLLVQLAHAGPLRDWLAERRASAASPHDIADDDSPADTGQLTQGLLTWRDVAYGPDKHQRLDVYAPKDAKQAPVIFMVHGGAWAIGDKAHKNVIQNKIAHWLPRGHVLVSVNYRMLPDADPLVQAQDLRLALVEAQKQAAQWGGDRQRFVLMGHSAGAHLIGLISASPDAAIKMGATPWLGSVLLDSAALDVPRIMQAPRHYRFYDKAFGQDPAFWAAASPAQVLSRHAPPLLAVCSSRRADACEQARSFADKAMGLGIRVEVLPQDLSHADINQQLGLPGAYTEAVDAFLASLPGVKPAVKPALQP
jgi:arylformamidase